MKNYPLVSFGLADSVAKAGITSMSQSGILSNATADDFLTGITTVLPYATYEQDYWYLDGNSHFIPASIHVGYVSDDVSDDDGLFTGGNRAHYLLFAFANGCVISDGTLVFHFDEYFSEYSNIYLKFEDATHAVIEEGEHLPDNAIYSVTGLTTTRFYYLYVYFESTHTPYRRARLSEMDFGITTHLDSILIKEAQISDNFSPIAATLAASQFTLDLLADDSSLSAVNPSGTFNNLQEHTPFIVYEVVDGTKVLMGVFYLDSWENISEREISLVCLDAIGIMAKLPFYGYVSDGVLGVVDFLTYIMAINGITCIIEDPHSRFSNPANTTLFGNIAPCSLRDCLQQIASAFKLSVKTSGSMWITISSEQAVRMPADSPTEDYAITLAQEAIEQVKLLPQITGVKYVWDRIYCPGGGSLVTVYTATLDPGVYLVKLSQPAITITVTGASIVNVPAGWNDSGAYYLWIQVATHGVVTITGNPGSTPFSFAIYNQIAAGTIDQDIEIDASIQISDGYDTAAWYAKYYGQRYYQKAMIYEQIAHTGDLVRIASLTGKTILGQIESTDINLLGLRTEVEIRGVLIKHFADTGLYADTGLFADA